jgi:pyrimidine deaminase RibD-like protein
MRLALSEAHESPPKPSNFRIGAVLVDEGSNKVLAMGYTLELPGNTYTEQCCL